MEKLEGKTCVITGGAGGIGLAMARRFCASGMRVVLGDVEEDALERATTELGGEVFGVVCDVTSPSSMDALRAATVERFGGVHIVCLNAGVAPIGVLLETAIETWRWTFEVNVLGVVHGIRTFGPGLVDQGEGHIVCTASAAGISTTYAMGAYTASKHAVVGIAATLREELRPAGVGVSVLCPGALRTRIFESDRDRPSELAGETYAISDDVVAAYRRAVAGAPDPSVAADAVVDAVLTNRLFVIPSPEVRGIVIERIDAVLAGLDAEGDR
jgi:NAD(P)-dependent dehydrogenase (short-subunit alcohol dehydrogenase family)